MDIATILPTGMALDMATEQGMATHIVTIIIDLEEFWRQQQLLVALQ